jgi:hypothetical protein
MFDLIIATGTSPILYQLKFYNSGSDPTMVLSEMSPIAFVYPSRTNSSVPDLAPRISASQSPLLQSKWQLSMQKCAFTLYFVRRFIWFVRDASPWYLIDFQVALFPYLVSYIGCVM